MEETTNQVTPPELRNPTGKGGFAEHPENRSDGHWDSKMVFSYQYKRFMNMTLEEMDSWNTNTPKDKRTVVEDLAFRRVYAAQKSLPDVKEMTDRTEGKAPQKIDVEFTDKPLTVLHLKHPEDMSDATEV